MLISSWSVSFKYSIFSGSRRDARLVPVFKPDLATFIRKEEIFSWNNNNYINKTFIKNFDLRPSLSKQSKILAGLFLKPITKEKLKPWS
jgi:hypothetical protein